MNNAEILHNNEIIPHIIGLFESAGIKQFESMNEEVELIGKPGKDSDVLKSYIDVTSDDLKVALSLSVPRSVLKKTIPGVPQGTNITDAMQEDWILELANRLLGRLKNKLLSHSCILHMGIPKSSQREDVDKLFDDGGQKESFFFDMNGEVVECYLSLNIYNENMEMDLYEDEDEDWFSESELEDL